MPFKRRSEKHLAPRLYVKRGLRKDTYWSKIAGKYYPLGNDRADAERKLKDLIEGKPVSGSIADLAERFIAHITSEVDSGASDALKPRTVTDYAEALRAHIVPIFGKMDPVEFQPKDAAQYLAKQKAKKRGVRANREVAALSSMFAFAMTEGIVSANPCHGVRRNKEIPRSRLPEVADMNAILKLAKDKGPGSYMVALIGALEAVTGRRRAEVLRLTRDCVTLEGLSGTEVKAKRGSANRSFIVSWTPFLRELINEAIALKQEIESNYLFPTRNGGPYSDSGYKCMWNRLMHEFVQQGGEWFTTHDLRALFVTGKLKKGEDPATHRNPATMHRVYSRAATVDVVPLR